ncbi:hypothetical protein FKM82_021541 [Ascaphus truei]
MHQTDVRLPLLSSVFMQLFALQVVTAATGVTVLSLSPTTWMSFLRFLVSTAVHEPSPMRKQGMSALWRLGCSITVVPIPRDPTRFIRLSGFHQGMALWLAANFYLF